MSSEEIDLSSEDSKDDEENKWKSLKYDIRKPNKKKIIYWNGWELIVLETPADGHCLFHSICGSFFIDYRKASEKEKVSMVKEFRKELSELLSIHYEKLHGGNILPFSEYVKEYTLDNMKKTLNSNQMVGYGYLQFICEAIEKDILIFDEIKKNV